MQGDEKNMSQSETGQGTAISAAAQAPAERPGLAASTLPALVFAVLFAAGATALQALAARSAGSFIAWEIVWASIIVWAAAACVLWVAAAVLLLPVLLLVRGRARLAILPAVVVAGGFIICAMGIRSSFNGKDALGASMVVSVWFIVPWSLFIGSVTAGLAARMPRGRRWQVTVFGIAAILFANGLAYFVWNNAKAYTLAVGPLALICAGAAVMDKVRRPKAAASIVLVASIAFCSTLAAFYYAGDSRTKGPVDRHFQPDPALTAMLAGKPNVILITMDTARADHMSLCGYKYPTTPNLKKFAADCRFFPYAESVDSWTLPTHASLFTGKYPRQHGARGDETIHEESALSNALWGKPLPQSQTTMAKYLSAKGYNTAAFVANYAWLSREFCLDQGFAYYHDMPRYLVFNKQLASLVIYGAEAADRVLGLNGKFVAQSWTARTVTNFATRWLHDNSSTPFLLFLNYMDPHGPYPAPPPFNHIDGPDIPFDARLSRQPMWGELRDDYIKNGKGLTPEVARALSNQYDAEIAYMDYWLGRLFESLKAQGVYDDSLIIITSDHGEYLGEHQLLSHGIGLYEGALRVPILVKYPRGEHAGEVVETRASIIDIFATVFDVLGLPMPDVPARALGGAPRPVFAEAPVKGTTIVRYGERFRGNLAAVYDGPWKYMRWSTGRRQLYNLATDPGELSDQLGAHPAEAERLDAALSDWMAKTPVLRETGRGASGEALRKLRSLGYIGGQ